MAAQKQAMLEKKQPTEVNTNMMFWLNIHGFVTGFGTLRLTYLPAAGVPPPVLSRTSLDDEGATNRHLHRVGRRGGRTGRPALGDRRSTGGGSRHGRTGRCLGGRHQHRVGRSGGCTGRPALGEREKAEAVREGAAGWRGTSQGGP